MAETYDDQNIFAKILRGEIPCDKVFESEHALAFRDISAQAPVHVLVIPKGAYIAYDDFAANASEAEILDFTRAVAEVCRLEKVSPASGGRGFRTITNAGPDGHQEVPHFHLHVLAGRPMGRLIAPAA